MKNAYLGLLGWPIAALISVATIAKKSLLGSTSIVLGIVRLLLLLLPRVAGIQPRHAAAPQPSLALAGERCRALPLGIQSE